MKKILPHNFVQNILMALYCFIVGRYSIDMILFHLEF